MEIIIKTDYQAACEEAARIILRAWKKRNSLVLGLATGRTPLGLYEKLILPFSSFIRRPSASSTRKPPPGWP